MTDATFQTGTFTKTPNSNVTDLVRAISTILTGALQGLQDRKQPDAGSILEAQNRHEVARRNADSLLR